MKALLIALLLLGSAGPQAATAATADRHARCEAQWRALPAGDPSRAEGRRPFVDRCLGECPDRPAHEAGRTYGARARDYCRLRWAGLLSARETGGLTHDEFVDGCLRRCVIDRDATDGAPLGWILGGLWSAALGYAVADVTGGGRPTPPPASP